MNQRRRGFSIIELLVVMVVIGILSRFGLPRYADMRSQTQARSIVGDVHAIRLAALNYNGDANKWPPNTAKGTTPALLVSYLPKGFKFRKPGVDMQWTVVNVTKKVGKKNVVTPTPRVTVTATDTKLSAALVKLARSGFEHVLVGKNVAFILPTGS